MKRYANIRPILFLMVCSAVLPEVLSGNTPLRQFLFPPTFLFLSLAYGIPVLIIREYAMRHRLSAGGIFWLGLGFGVINEGFLAKTLLMSRNVPNPAFDAYGMWLGVNWTWTMTICLWHAGFSVLLPITITHHLFPAESARLWLNRKTILLLLSSSAFICFAIFLSGFRMHGSPLQLIVLLGLIALCVAIATRFQTTGEELEPQSIPIAPFLIGWCILPAYILLSAIAARKLPFPDFPIAYALMISGFVWSLKSHRWLTPRPLLVFGCGAYMQSALMALTLRLATHTFVPDSLIAEGAALIFFLFWQRKLRSCVNPRLYGQGDF